MEYLPEERPTGTAMILCCECGTAIEANAANMCVPCLRTQIDITEGIPKQGTIYFCKSCERYLQPPGAWVKAALESRELLSLCLKKIKGIGKDVRLIDAGFVWTEPHSKRIKVKLTIQKQVMNDAVLQQVFVVEFVVHYQMCDECHRVEAKDFWRAVVQIRQKAAHKKTLFYLEQLVLKHRAHVNTTNIKQVHEGLDFFYAQKADSKKLVDFLQQVVPCKYDTAKELVSHDIHCGTYNYKNTYSVEIVPVCKDNIVCLPCKLAQQIGNMGQICVVYRVTQSLHVIDPNTCQVAEITGALYWRYPFLTICQPKQMTEYLVMDIEIVKDKDRAHVAGHSQQSQKHVLAEVWVSKSSDMGMSEDQFFCRTHLGHLLNIGDTALGFDVRCANINDDNFDKMKAEKIPDVILVKKLYSDSNKRSKKRKWKLKHLAATEGNETEGNERAYTEFLEDLEEDTEYRRNINIYKDQEKLAVDTDDTTDDEGAPRVSLAEMLDDLHLVEDATGGEGAAMTE